jgi:hypothetical protein
MRRAGRAIGRSRTPRTVIAAVRTTIAVIGTMAARGEKMPATTVPVTCPLRMATPSSPDAWLRSELGMVSGSSPW